ncbi:hypothetical protein BKA57DRAFT_526109 [Linnemannia elongata]|nr:hypothetical protein BKA57DRAFT_526109 [Linnemannia elongata]
MTTPRQGTVFMSKVFLSFQEEVVAAVLMKKVVLPKNIPDNMLRALEVSSSNQSNDMHVLRKSLTAVNDTLAHQSNQSLWANNILDALAKSFLAQEQQLRIQRETIESMQQAIDAMARQLRLQGSVAPGNPGNLSYSRQSGIPGPGYLGYTGISTPAPGFLPHLGPFPGHQSPMPKQKQSKLVQNRALVAIQPSHSGSSSQVSSIEKGGSISAEQALSHAFEEMDTLVKFNSNKNMFSFAQARTFCGKTAKEREEERKSNL